MKSRVQNEQTEQITTAGKGVIGQIGQYRVDANPGEMDELTIVSAVSFK